MFDKSWCVLTIYLPKTKEWVEKVLYNDAFSSSIVLGMFKCAILSFSEILVYMV